MKRVWISSREAEVLVVEAQSVFPLETGGVLAGYCSADDDDVVITNVVGPGPNAAHSKHHFIPDYDFHKSEIGKIFDSSGGCLTYLGDWHSHPEGYISLSSKDKKALRNIAKYPGNYMDNPIMLILGVCTSYDGNTWCFNAWRAVKGNGFLIMTGWEYPALEAKLY